jgi:AcrR family transcriptional regulator
MSTTVIVYDGGMGRWEPDARGRLVNAALELYSERGFEDTTVEQIAKRAGLTERTYFRHFADKREVLFSGAHQLDELMLRALDAAPAALSPIDAIGAVLQAMAADFEDRRAFAQRRQRIIVAHAELQERERIKLASLAASLAAALRRRGVADSAATLAAELAIAVFRVAFERWVDETNRHDFARIVRETLHEVRTVSAGM